MAKNSTMNELKAMQRPDLLREIKAQELLVSKLRVGVELKKEKDTARLKRERRQLARMCTEWTRKTSLPPLPTSAPDGATAGKSPPQP